jgi:hypothetical protein
MPSNYIQKINGMDIKRLQLELLECDDSNIVKKMLIKKIIKLKLLEKKQRKYQLENQNKVNIKVPKMESSFDPLDELIKCNSPEKDIESPKSKPVESKFTNEILKDQANNKLMDRLTNELDFRSRGYDKKTFEKPYADIGDNVYCPPNTQYQTGTLEHTFDSSNNVFSNYPTFLRDIKKQQ